MKKLFLTSIAALLLATGTAQAAPPTEQELEGLCWGPPNENGTPTDIPCDQLGEFYDCGVNADDDIYIRHQHLLSDLSSTTITIYSRAGSGRKQRTPVIHYDKRADALTLNGRRCKKVD
jgi:hypothetical protein